MRAYVRHLGSAVPYYRDLFRRLGVSPDDIKGLEDLRAVPVTSREMIQEQLAVFSAQGPVARYPQLTAHTSGTTGGGLRFPVTVSAHREQWAVWWRYRRSHGIERSTWCGSFGGRTVVPPSQQRPPFWRYDWAGRQILFSGYHMSPETLGSYVRELQRRRPPWLSGYPSLLSMLAAYLVEHNIDLGYQVRCVTVLAENLLAQQRLVIEQGFGMRPRQHYGLAEGAANFSECELGQLHVDEDYAAVEFLPTQTADVYRVVGTAFTNYAFGFLRYEVQDHVTLAQANCTCGRPGRVVAAIDGRSEDYVILRNGARVGRMDHIFKDLTEVREAQIYQRRPGEVIFRVVRRPGYTASDEQHLRSEALQRLGRDTDVQIQYVDSLTRGPTGKLKFVVSDLEEAQIDQRPDVSVR